MSSSSVNVIGNVPDNVVSAINGRIKLFMAGLKARNASDVAAIYCKDAIVMAPNMPSAEGRTDIANIYDAFFKQGITDCIVTLQEVGSFDSETRSPTTVFERATHQLYAGSTLVETGKCLGVWKFIDGEWFIFRDCFNGDGNKTTPSA